VPWARKRKARPRSPESTRIRVRVRARRRCVRWGTRRRVQGSVGLHALPLRNSRSVPPSVTPMAPSEPRGRRKAGIFFFLLFSRCGGRAVRWAEADSRSVIDAAQHTEPIRDRSVDRRRAASEPRARPVEPTGQRRTPGRLPDSLDPNVDRTGRLALQQPSVPARGTRRGSLNATARQKRHSNRDPPLSDSPESPRQQPLTERVPATGPIQRSPHALPGSRPLDDVPRHAAASRPRTS